jgi:S1-C subfamily serine protease
MKFVRDSVALLVAMSGIAWAAPEARKELTLEEVARRCKNAVARIDTVAYDHEGHETKSSATGFFVGTRGRILTNAHVVRHEPMNPETWKRGPRAPSDGPHPDHATIYCFPRLGKRHWRASLVGFDKYVDLGLLRAHGIRKDEYAVLPIGDPTKLRVGSKVFVYGNSSGIEGSSSEGVVNQIGVNQGYNFVERDIQVSANFAEGGSGSPLLNAYGEVVGVMYATARTTGLAIPMTLFDEERLSHGEVKLGYFGARVMSEQEVPFGFLEDGYTLIGKRADIRFHAPIKQIMKVIQGHGVLVVLPKDDNSPATTAGIELGDVIVRLNGERVRNETDLNFAIWRAPLGKPIAVVVWRFDEDGKRCVLTKTVTLTYGS